MSVKKWVMSYEWWVMEIEWRKLSDQILLPKQALNILISHQSFFTTSFPFASANSLQIPPIPNALGQK